MSTYGLDEHWFAFRWCLFVKFLRMTISVQFWKSNQEVLDHCANWKELLWKPMTQFRRYVKLSTKVVKTKIVASSIDLINDALKRVHTFKYFQFLQLTIVWKLIAWRKHSYINIILSLVTIFNNLIVLITFPFNWNFSFFKNPALKPRTFDTFPNKRKEFPWKFHVGWFFTL